MRMFTPRFGPGHSRFILHTRSPEKQKDSFYFQACEVRLQCSSFRTTQPSSIHFQHPVSSRAKISRQTYVIFSYTVELVAADLSAGIEKGNKAMSKPPDLLTNNGRQTIASNIIQRAKNHVQSSVGDQNCYQSAFSYTTSELYDHEI